MKVNTSQNMRKYDLDKKCIGYSPMRGRKRNINKENIKKNDKTIKKFRLPYICGRVWVTNLTLI